MSFTPEKLFAAMISSSRKANLPLLYHWITCLPV